MKKPNSTPEIQKARETFCYIMNHEEEKCLELETTREKCHEAISALSEENITKFLNNVLVNYCQKSLDPLFKAYSFIILMRATVHLCLVSYSNYQHAEGQLSSKEFSTANLQFLKELCDHIGVIQVLTFCDSRCHIVR